MLDWFAGRARSFPWREHPSPYYVWVSEMMLQQTQMATVLPYFQRFVARFPDVDSLAEASVDEVLKMWEGMGYYRRAHLLHRAAQVVVEQYGGELPADEEALLALPGVGPYTAGAILSIAFGKPAPILDGNAKRVLSRLDDVTADIDRAATVRQLWARAAELVDPNRPGDFNQALMELGSLVCLPRRPRCASCPLQAHCLAYARGTQSQRPVRRSRKKTPHYDVVAGVVWHATEPERFLITQRPSDGMLAGLWEFPGGKKQDGENLEQALARELREELGIAVEVGEPLPIIKHAYSHFRITLHPFHARHVAGEPQCLQVAAWRWVSLDELHEFAFARTDQRVIAFLRAAAPRRYP
ncbi:MAG: A/G-specific adenine glycosylase [Chloroflexi bacterium]|nr:A/G-specific adenine glycosylase [Chloroflexota bacterium]